MERRDVMEKISSPSVCNTNSMSIAIPPIILVPNIGGVLVPPIHNGVQYVVAPEPDTEQSLSKCISHEDTKSKTEEEVQEEQKHLLGKKSALTQEIKSVSPMQLFNIQDNSEIEESSIMFGKFAESPLLHESSKDVTLVSGTHDLLDEMGPPKAGSGFVETSESTYLFTSLNENVLEQLPVPIHAKNKKEAAINAQHKDESCGSKSCPLDDDESGIETSKHLIKSLEKALSDSSDCTEDVDEVKLEDELQPIVVHIPENSSYTSVIKEELQLGIDPDCIKSAPIILPANSIDISLIPVVSMESLMFGNIAFVPPTSTPIKFQVIDNDGSVKRISVNPICQMEKDLIRADVATDAVEGRNFNFGPTSPVIAEVIPSLEGQRPFKCELCSATFTRFGNYTRHKKIHTVPTKEDQRFHCEVCGKSFIQRCDLTRHMHIHSGTEPHRCTICGKGYIRHSDLVIHQRFHNKEKPFCCPHCAKGFSQRGDLNRHLRSIHLQVKPLTCGHCQKKFAKEATLIRHMQVTHRDIILNSITKCSSESLHLRKRSDVAFPSDSAFLTLDSS